MITSISTFFNTAPPAIPPLALQYFEGWDSFSGKNRLLDWFPFPPSSVRFPMAEVPCAETMLKARIKEPAESSLFDDLTTKILFGLAAVAGAVALIEGILYIRERAKYKALLAMAAADKAKAPPAEPNGSEREISTVTVERKTWAPEKVIANLMMREDRELGAKKEELERAVTAAINEWFELSSEQREGLLKDAPPEAVTFAEDGVSEKILYPWVKERSLKIYAESPKLPPPRGAQARDEIEISPRILASIKDALSVQDVKDAPTIIKKAESAVSVLAADFAPLFPDFAHEKTGLLGILGEMLEFYGGFKPMQMANEWLVQYAVVSIGADQTSAKDFADSFRYATPAQKFLLLGNLAIYSNSLPRGDIRAIMDRVAASEPKDGPIRELANIIIAGRRDSQKVMEEAVKEALNRFHAGGEWAPNKSNDQELVSARMKAWRSRFEAIETRIRDAREAKLGKRR